MIKSTFYNLSPEKQEKIIDVTRKEFMKGNKQKITINSVIKNAGISRGSFYQYFDEKLDLVQLVTDDMFKRMILFIQDELTLNGGDIFELPERIFDITNYEVKEFSDFLTITPANNQNSDLISDYMEYRYHETDYLDDFYGYINTENFKDNSKENVQCVVMLLFDVIKSSIISSTKSHQSREEARKILNQKVAIIKAGVTK